MNTEVIVGIVGACTTVVSGWTSYFFTRRKYHTQVDGLDIQNMRDTLSFYKEVCESNRESLKILSEQNVSLTKQVVDLQNQVLDLQRQIAQLAINICVDTGCVNRTMARSARAASEEEATPTKKKRGSSAKAVKYSDAQGEAVAD